MRLRKRARADAARGQSVVLLQGRRAHAEGELALARLEVGLHAQRHAPLLGEHALGRQLAHVHAEPAAAAVLEDRALGHQHSAPAAVSGLALGERHLAHEEAEDQRRAIRQAARRPRLASESLEHGREGPGERLHDGA